MGSPWCLISCGSKLKRELKTDLSNLYCIKRHIGMLMEKLGKGKHTVIWNIRCLHCRSQLKSPFQTKYTNIQCNNSVQIVWKSLKQCKQCFVFLYLWAYWSQNGLILLKKCKRERCTWKLADVRAALFANNLQNDIALEAEPSKLSCWEMSQTGSSFDSNEIKLSISIGKGFRAALQTARIHPQGPYAVEK